MKRLILIGAFVLAGATALIVAANTCSSSCPLCPPGTDCPADICPANMECCKK